MGTHRFHTSSGMAATEFVLVALPLLAMGLGAFEVARWHLVRQSLSYALLEAGRAGAVHHGSPEAIQTALQQALTPVQDARATRMLQEHYALPAWQIEVLGPTARHFDDFPGPPHNGMRTIRHSYQHEQHARAVARGNPQGRGAASGETIFEANTLVLRLTYLHAPLVPGMRSLVRAAGRLAGGEGAMATMRAAGVVPMRQHISVTMQSAPHEWGASNPAAGITGANGQTWPSADSLPGPPPSAPAACLTGECSPAPVTGGRGDTHAVTPGQQAAPVPDDGMAQACAAALCC